MGLKVYPNLPSPTIILHDSRLPYNGKSAATPHWNSDRVTDYGVQCVEAYKRQLKAEQLAEEQG